MLGLGCQFDWNMSHIGIITHVVLVWVFICCHMKTPKYFAQSIGRVAQWIRRPTSNRKIVGSIPIVVSFTFMSVLFHSPWRRRWQHWYVEDRIDWNWNFVLVSIFQHCFCLGHEITSDVYDCNFHLPMIIKKLSTMPGLEPGIPWFVVRCLIHWATRPCVAKESS